MGNIGIERREVEFEPLTSEPDAAPPQAEPEREPERTTEPTPA